MSNKKVASTGAILAASDYAITHYDTPLDVNADFR